jgi:hypothetical protein
MDLINRVVLGEIDEDWEITAYPEDVRHVYEELLWELKEYRGQVQEDFVVIHDKTAFQIAVLLKAMHGMAGNAVSDVMSSFIHLMEE